LLTAAVLVRRQPSQLRQGDAAHSRTSHHPVPSKRTRKEPVAPEIEKLATKYAGKVDVVKVDVDANPNLSRSLNIMSIPTIAMFTRPAPSPGRGARGRSSR